MTVRMLTKMNTLKNRNTRCFLVLKSCLPRSTACKREQRDLFLALHWFCLYASSYYSSKKETGDERFTLTVRNVARITTQESA